VFGGRFEDAAVAARQAAALDPGNAEAHGVWGAAALEAGWAVEAEHALAKASGLTAPGSPQWAHASSLHAKTLVGLGRWADAFRIVSAVEQAHPADVVVRDRLGEVFTRINLADRAVPHFEAAAGERPERVDFRFNLASGYRFVGRMAQAERAYEAAIAGAPELATAHMALAELRRWTAQDNHLERLQALARRPGLSVLDRARIGYALFKELDDLGETAAAWPHLVEASERAIEVFGRWSADGERRWAEALIEGFPRERLAAPGTVAGDTRFIFVVGLPRSGTTLVERILAAHSQVTAMGELPTFGLLMKRAAGVESAEFADEAAIRTSAGIDWGALGQAYRQEIAYLSRGAPFAIDKLPDNAALLGPIRLAFPDAVIVRLSRDPRDSLFGAYRLLFHRAHYWSYRQEDLAAHFANMQRLDRHWSDALEGGIVDVSYEDLTEDPGRRIPELLAACGLSWEDACLRPHETQGVVSTASSSQVRQPITRARVGAWARYGAQLEPLRQALADLGS
jgi:tetratricopeptide (TPR) repeat protein